MMERVKTALITSYAGTILTGWILANGVMSVISIIMLPILQVLDRSYNQQSALGTSSFRLFDPTQLALGALRAVLILAAGLLLLRWLYMPPKVPDGLIEEDEEPPIS